MVDNQHSPDTSTLEQNQDSKFKVGPLSQKLAEWCSRQLIKPACAKTGQAFTPISPRHGVNHR